MTTINGSVGTPITASTITPASDAILYARRMLEDAIGPEHQHTDEKLLAYVIEAQNQLAYSIRPALRISMTLYVPGVITDPVDALSVPARFVPALGLFAASRALQEDNADTANQAKSDRMLKQAMEAMING